MSAISLEQFETSLSFWENAGYVALASVIGCCFAEYLHVKEFWYKEGSWWTKEGGAFAALLLVVALASEMFTQFRTNEFSGRIIAQQKLNAAITEERLLNERRLTANERWRLERFERAALARFFFINFGELANRLKREHFSPISLAVINRPEPMIFGMQMRLCLQTAGMSGPFLLLAEDGKFSGARLFMRNAEGHRLSSVLRQSLRISGYDPTAAAPIEKVYPELASLPAGQNILVIGENDGAWQPGDGQPGEGVDAHGGSDPAPH